MIAVVVILLIIILLIPLFIYLYRRARVKRHREELYSIEQEILELEDKEKLTDEEKRRLRELRLEHSKISHKHYDAVSKRDQDRHW